MDSMSGSKAVNDTLSMMAAEVKEIHRIDKIPETQGRIASEYLRSSGFDEFRRNSATTSGVVNGCGGKWIATIVRTADRNMITLEQYFMGRDKTTRPT